MKKESSRDEEENEDEGSTPKAEEYDPMEAEDADDDDDDDGNALLMLKYSINCFWMSHNIIWSMMKNHAPRWSCDGSSVSETLSYLFLACTVLTSYSKKKLMCCLCF